MTTWPNAGRGGSRQRPHVVLERLAATDRPARALAMFGRIVKSSRRILRVLPYWPDDRHLELAPKYWHATRGRLRPEEIVGPLSGFEVPPVNEIVAAAAGARPS